MPVGERGGAWHDFGVSTPPTESRRVPDFPWNWRRVVIGSVVVILLLWAIPTVIEWLTSGDEAAVLIDIGQSRPD
jgi:hypothetical protein